MKKTLTLIFLSLLIVMPCNSQSISYPKILGDSLVVITPQQLKAANLIFLEHSKLKQELQLKDMIISEQEEMINRHTEIDSINTKSFNTLSTELIRSKEVMDSLRSNLEKSKHKLKVLKGVSIGGFSLSLALITLIFIK